MFDFNQAPKQSEAGTLIPHGTIAPVEVRIRSGGAGDERWLMRSKDGTCLMIKFDITILEGEYAGVKFSIYLTVEGETERQLKAATISRSRLRAMLESAYGIDPSDASDRAIAARRTETLEKFDGLRLWIVVGIEKGKDGYPDRNSLLAVLTPDRKGWRKLEQVIAPISSSPDQQRPGGRPPWA